MKSELLQNVQREMKDEKAVRGAIQFFVWVIIIAVVAFCEIMYVKIMLIGFPDGLVRFVAIAGAIATGMSVIMLYAGKNHWFSKGPQTWAAWIFTGVEICILILNVILAFNFDEPSLDFWKQAYPAAPIAALIGWGIVLYLDRQNIMRRRQREMQEEQHEAELAYEGLVHNTRMTVKSNSLQIVADKLEAKLQSAEADQHLEGIANEIYRAILGEISGKHVTQIPGPRVVDAGKPVQMAQTASVPNKCSACGTSGPGDYDLGVWLCQSCLSITRANRQQHLQAIRQSLSPLAPAPSNNQNGANLNGSK